MTFEQFKNYHLNETIVVCGLGESVRSFRPADGITTIGVNDIGRLFHPTYLLNVNNRTQYKGDRFRYIENTQAKYLFTHTPGEQGNVKIPIIKFEIAPQGGGVEIKNNRLPHFRNSPYVGVALASYMGASVIGLIGVDFTDNHFWLQDGKHRLVCELSSIDEHYGKLAAHLYQSRQTRVYNLSPTSKITSLTRITLDDLPRGSRLSS